MKASIALRNTLYVLMLLSLAGCDNKDFVEEKQEINPAFGAYVAAFTSGVISVEDPIWVRLAVPAGQDAHGGRLLTGNTLTFEPSLSGTATWQDPYTIKFVPNGELPSGTVFVGKLALGTLTEVDKGYENFTFQFQTIVQDLSLHEKTMEAGTTTGLDKITYRGTIHTADIADPDVLVKSVKATLNGSPLKTQISATGDRTFDLTIADIPRAASTGTLRIEFSEKLLKIDNPKAFEFSIPALGEFTVLGVTLSQGEDQKVTVAFSDPLATQDLRGLITLEGVASMRMEQSANLVELYPSTRVLDTKMLTVYASVKNAEGKPLSQEYSRSVAFRSEDPNVRVLGGKTILPKQDKGLIFDFEAVSLSAVDVYVSKIFANNILQYFQDNDLGGDYQMGQIGRHIYRKHINLRAAGGLDLGKWNRYHIDLTDILSPDKGALYRIEIRFRQAYATFPCGEENGTGVNELSTAGQDGWVSDGTYYYDNYYAEYRYDWENSNNPCNQAYYSPYKSKAATVAMATNIGLTAKRGGDGNLTVIANDIGTTNPLPGAQIDLYDYQQQKIGGGITDMNGFVTIDCPRSPFVVTAAYGSDRSYLKVQGGNVLSLSKFDVDGTTVQEGVKGFIYGERGVWRPGDSLYLNFILQDAENILPTNHPVSMDIFDPRNRKVSSTVQTASTNGFYDFRTATDSDAPTGTYRAEVSVGNRTFARNLKIETIKPNRLKVELKLNDPAPASKVLTGTLEAHWLHGAAAPGLDADITMGLRPKTTVFEGYNGFVFDNNLLYGDLRGSDRIFEGKLNARGQAQISGDVKALADYAPGMMEAYFETKVREPGGGFSINYQSEDYSPYTRYAGLRIPEGSKWGGSLQTGETQNIDVVSLTVDGKPSDGKYLKASLYRVDWRWWYDRYNGNGLNYVNSTSVDKISDQKIPLTQGRGTWSVKVSDANWGRYLLVVKDPQSGHSAASFAYFDWPYNRRANRAGDASTILGLVSDKDTYSPGDSAVVSFLSPENGRALISIENGTKVLNQYWLPTDQGATDIKLAILADMAPNVFVHVSLLQPHSQTTNDRPLRMYGIVPINVESPDSRLNPVLDVPEVLRPEKEFSVTVSEKDAKAMTYTLAVVDEGLLDLTGFATPAPHDLFYAREALGVETWDLYDQVFGALDLGRSEVLRIGGDERGIDPSKQKARRFEPVVRFVGPVELAKGQSNTHRIKMPNYIGSVRVMVVAGTNKAYGHAEATRPVRSPLMVMGTLPRIVGPGERIALPINVFAMENQVKDVRVGIETNALFEAESPTKQSLHFEEPGNQLTYFTLNTPAETGRGTVKGTASGNGKTSTFEVNLEVRSPNPPYTVVEDRSIAPGETWKGEFGFFGVDGTNEAVLELSEIPPINLSEKLQYLIRYPHGCVEQIVSGGFPQLVIVGFGEVTAKQRTEIEVHIRSTLRKLRHYQTASGGLSFWPGKSVADPWGTSYAGHFMLVAEKAGYALPVGLKSQWIKYQKQSVREWASRPERVRPYSMRTQAYRLFTLALAGQAEFSGMNHLSNVSDLDLSSRYILAMAYAGAGRPETGASLIKNQVRNIPAYTELSYTYGSDIRDEGFVLMALKATGFTDDATETAMGLAKKLSREKYLGTQTTAMALLALADYLGDNYKGGVKASFSTDGKVQNIATGKPLVKMYPMSANGRGKYEVVNEGEAPLYAKLVVSGQPVAGKEQDRSANLLMEVKYLDDNGNTVDIGRLELGKDLIAEVKITNPGTRGDLEGLALTQVFPSGWEILNPRMAPGETMQSAQPDYQDIRDDRVMSYFNLKAGATISFRTRLNAAYAGRFYLPATVCNAMYDERIGAVRSGRWVNVSR